MAIFCIPKHLVEKLKTSALKGEVNIKELYGMSSAERRTFFAKHTDKELGLFINTEFEKAMVSKQKDALTEWAKSVFSPKAQEKPTYKNVLDKIKTLDEIGVLNPKSEEAFLQDLVAEKLGVTVSVEEVRQIQDRAAKIDEAQIRLGDDLGNPDKLDENLAFFKAKKQMDDYLSSLSPAPKLRVLTGTIGRGMMLFSVKSPILNIASNTELAFMEGLIRRLANVSSRGANNKLALDYVKMVNKVYQATGYDLSRMESLSDSGASGARVLGDTVHTQGPGKTRMVGRVIEDIVFKQLMGAPDAAFASAHFADSVNLAALRMANGDKAKASAMMKDAMRISPQTIQGELLREQARFDAQYATWTNDSWASKATLGIRKVFNEVSGDLRLGDQLMPFVKTPANVISTGLDYAGLGIPKALIDTVNAYRSGELGSKQYQQQAARSIVRSGLGLATAAMIAGLLDDDDFVGAYDPTRWQIEELRNSRENSIRIGGKWISTDWLGPLAVPVTAIMYARKYGNTPQETAFQYVKGAAQSIGQLPGVEDAIDFIKSQERGAETLEESTGAAWDYATNYVYSRLVPGFITDLAKATDEFERKTGTGLSSIKSRVPGLRQTLPIKKNIFGEEMRGEQAVTDILFGARVRTDKETALVKEINTVATANDKGVTFTDWERSDKKNLYQFKVKVGLDTYEEARAKYGQRLKTELEKVVASDKYKKAFDADKLKLINEADSLAEKATLKEYKFAYKPVKEVPENTPLSSENFIKSVSTYAKALNTDPVTAFDRMFSGQKIVRVDGDTIVVERMSFKESQAVKEKGGGNTPDFKLDHTIPLQLGGSNSEDNLKLVSTDEWASYTEVENHIGNLVRDGNINREQAQSLIRDFKAGKITREEVLSR